MTMAVSIPPPMQSGAASCTLTFASQPELAHHGQRVRGKGLVQFYDVEVIQLL
jgi:hypothetical protein